MFVKYGFLFIYDEDTEKIFIINHEQIQFDKNLGWNLIVVPEKRDGTLSNHEYFCIHHDIFDRIQSTHKDINTMWSFISNEPNENESLSKST